MGSPLVPNYNISFLGMRNKWSEVDFSGGSDPGTTDIKISEFRGATFVNGTTIQNNGQISINNFKGRTFDTIINKFETDNFRAYSDWSAHSSLIGTTGSSSFTGSTTSNKRVQLNGTGQSSGSPYPILLLSPYSSSSYTPGIVVDRSASNVVDEATVWFRVIAHNSYNQVQFGILAKDMTLDNWSSQKSYLGNKHATYCDRLGFHGGGYHNYSGSRDDITDTSIIVSPQYNSGKYGSNLTPNFHTRTGTTAGTQRSYNANSTPTEGQSVYFFSSNLTNYSTYRGNTIYPNHGLKIKWYEKTLNASLESGSNIIRPTSGSWSSSDLDGIFSGMYVSGSGIDSNDGAFIADIHTNYMLMYKSKGLSSMTLKNNNATSNYSNVTLTISGYLYWTLVTSPESSSTSNTNYIDAKILGPPHQVLPKYQAGTPTSAPTNEIKEWAFYIGDTTSGTTNTLSYDLRNDEPGGTPFSYSVSYTSGTIPSSNALSGAYIGSTAIQSGDAGTSIKSFTFNLKDASYVGQSVIGSTGRIVFKYTSGTNYRGDIQIVVVTWNGASGSSYVGSHYQDWERNSISNPSSYPTIWSTVGTSYLEGHWLRDTYNTGSPNTGVSIPGQYSYACIYFETSVNGKGFPNKTGYLRQKHATTFTSDSVTVKYYAYGVDIGNLYAGVEF